MRFASAIVALTTLAALAGAQSSNHAVVRIAARDSAGTPIPLADVAITKGLKDVIAHTTTDSSGRAIMSVAVNDSTDFQLTMRKIGIRRTDRFFQVGPKDTAVVNLVVAPPHGTDLAPVRVVEKRVRNRFESYDLTADDIQNSDRFLVNGWEAVKLLRPVMLTSRGGCATGALEVWVNGKRIRLPLRPTGLDSARALVGAPPHTRVSYVPISVMSSIAPEHIQEVHYHDCFDHSMAVVGSNDAIFITLKPGVVYVENEGSFVVSEAEERKASQR